MASFGRLEIYWSDSPAENFILAKSTIAIGRSTGNDLVVDRNGISRYHAKLAYEDQRMTLTDLDSVNGVYVDSIKIKAGEPLALRGGEEIQIADVRLVYYPEEMPDETIPTPLSDTTQSIQTELLSLQVISPDMVVVPGAHVQAVVQLENLAENTMRYLLTVEGVPKEWVRLERSEIELDSGEPAKIIANFKPTRRSETRPGNYPLVFKVHPKDKPETVMQVESLLTVGSYSGYGAVMGTTITTGGNPFRLYTHNQGNDQLKISFRGVDPQNILRFDIHPPQVTLQAGERRTIEGSIHPRGRNLFGATRKFRYDVITLSQDPSRFQAPVSGYYLTKPLLPSWAAMLAVPLVAVVAIGFIVLVLSILGGENKIVPQINNFSAMQEEFVLGEPITLQWETTGVQSAAISYVKPDQQPQEIPVDNPTVNVYQLNLQTSGVYTITLNVENTGGKDTSAVVVRVLPAITNFSANPSTLIRHITQDIELSWSVAGAEVVNGEPLVSLESSLSIIQSSGLPEQGSQTFSILPLDAVTVTLRVDGLDGTQNSRNFNFALEDPRCVLANPNALVAAGPGRFYAVLDTIDTPAFVVNPIARDVDNLWLHIPYATGLAWVRVADFDCQGFETAQLDPEVNVPPPPATATPTSTPTPIPTSTPTATSTPTSTPTLKPSATQTPRHTPTSRSGG